MIQSLCNKSKLRLEKILYEEYGMQRGKTIEGSKRKQDREKMKWVLFRLQTEKKQYEEK